MFLLGFRIILFRGKREMTNRRTDKLWIVNVISFMLFIMLTLTGLVNWLVLPKGYGASGGFLASLRHFLIEVHEWTALLFIIVVATHIVLHWTYIRANLKKHGIIK